MIVKPDSTWARDGIILAESGSFAVVGRDEDASVEQNGTDRVLQCNFFHWLISDLIFSIILMLLIDISDAYASQGSRFVNYHFSKLICCSLTSARKCMVLTDEWSETSQIDEKMFWNAGSLQ